MADGIEEAPATSRPPAQPQQPQQPQVFKLWPPSQVTREAVRQKMALKLSSACLESQSFAKIELAEAQEQAKVIEEAAFIAAQEADRNGEETGSAVVMVYAKHASKLMLEALRSQGGPENRKLENVKPVASIVTTGDGIVGSENGAVVSKDEEQANDSTVALNEEENKDEEQANDSTIALNEEEDKDEEQANDSTVALNEEEDKDEEQANDSIVTLNEEEDKETSKAFDISGGARAFLTEEYAEKLLRPLLEENSFTSVCLSNWSFGDGSAEVAARALSTLKHKLVDVNLADIVAGRPEVEALNAMTIISSALEGSKLKSLNLSDNALGEKGIRAFSALLSSQDSLEALYFMNNGISEDAARAIREILPSSKELRTLRFHNNMSGDQGAVELAAGVIGVAPHLEHFQFSSSRVGSEGGIALMESLRGGKSLRSIDIRDNMYGPSGGAALGQTLRSHTLLTEVYLSDLGLEDEGALAVIEALTEGSSQVTILELGGNEITEKVAPALAACIRSMKLLKRLNLMENELRDKGAVIVSSAIKDGLDSLCELDLSVNEIGRIGAVAAAQAVANKIDFKSLNLNGNQISEQGIEALQDVLAKSAAGAAILCPLDENEAEEDQEDEDDEVASADENDVVAGFSDLDVADKD